MVSLFLPHSSHSLGQKDCACLSSCFLFTIFDTANKEKEGQSVCVCEENKHKSTWSWLKQDLCTKISLLQTNFTTASLLIKLYNSFTS